MSLIFIFVKKADMRFKTGILFLLLPLLSPAIPSFGRQAGTMSSPASDTLWHGTPRKISAMFGFTEGPAVDGHGNVYFTDQPNNRIWKYGTDGKLSVFIDSAGRSNGMYFDKKGNLITCADEKDQLWSISPKGKVTVLVADFEGHRLNGPNDIWVSPNGGMYFSDPYYQRDYWKRKTPDLKSMDVYYLPPGGGPVKRVVDNLIRPNGLVGTPDGKHLYISDIDAKKIYIYTIAGDGRLKDRRVFITGHPTDGMTIDEEGDLFLCGSTGVTIFNSKGTQIGYIPIPEPWTANACFGGRNRDQLFIAASKALYVIPMKVKGVR